MSKLGKIGERFEEYTSAQEEQQSPIHIIDQRFEWTN